MFERFGEMESVKEINELAENLFNEGDIDSLRVMAAENGIPEDFVALYLEGDIPELCDAQTAALGKIEVECKELNPKEIMEDWVDYIKIQIMENDLLARQVRRKGKTLEGCIGALLQWSFGHQQKISQDILKAAGVNNARVTLGIPGMGTAKKLIISYYMGK